MKYLKYYAVILLSVLCILLPSFGLLLVIIREAYTLLIPWGIFTILCVIFSRPLSSTRRRLRRETEYDEFGMSKSKGSYDRLSKAERNAIDLQRTADMERVINTTALKKMTKQGSSDPEADMEALIGLVPVKQKMREMAARMKFEKSSKGKEDSMSGRHMVFYGSPGTGKTTVARILTGFLYKYGYIKKNKCVEIDGNFLKAGVDTALKTEMTIRNAYDGVLFIDEAYALMESGDRTGAEAIATLIKQMEDARGKFVLILAGYTKEMQQLLAANPGFESRIKEYLVFPDYNAEEMREIFQKMAAEKGFSVSEDAFARYDERIRKERRLRSFGNGRTARNVLEESIDKHALNFAERKLNSSEKYVLHGMDISPDLKQIGFA